MSAHLGGPAEAHRVSTQLKEFVMNEAAQVEVVDLGDAKEITKGSPMPPLHEDNPIVSFQHVG